MSPNFLTECLCSRCRSRASIFLNGHQRFENIWKQIFTPSWEGSLQICTTMRNDHDSNLQMTSVNRLLREMVSFSSWLSMIAKLMGYWLWGQYSPLRYVPQSVVIYTKRYFVVYRIHTADKYGSANNFQHYFTVQYWWWCLSLHRGEQRYAQTQERFMDEMVYD